MTINLDTNHLSRLLSESSQAEKHETYKNQKDAQNTKKNAIWVLPSEMY